MEITLSPCTGSIPNEIKELYEEAFPQIEKRAWPQQLILFEEQRLQLLKIEIQDAFAGFIFYWLLNGFAFIEHFAILPEMRGQHIGRKAIQTFIPLHPLTILETEKESTGNHAVRRITFYEKLGFKIFPHPYLQPPYITGNSFLTMHLMHNGHLPEQLTFHAIKKEIYRKVYQLTI